MRRFLITSSKFTGTAEIFYNTDEVLFKIDCLDTNMDAETIRHFKRAVPATISELIENKSFSTDTVIVEAGYRIPFDKFWGTYNKKINKLRCIPLYERLTDAETVECLYGIKPYDKFLQGEKVRQKLDPENWIKLKSWQNDWKNL